MKRSSSPSSQSPPSLANDSLVADDEKTSEIEQKRAQDAIDQLKKIQLLKEIESLKPDHEQRQLAIEVCLFTCLFDFIYLLNISKL